MEALVEEAVVDAYGDEEKTVGFFTMIEEHLALPFSVSIMGVEAVVEKVDLTRDGRIVAVCQRNGIRSDDDWDDGTGWMGSLVSLRSDLLRGDLRCLYLGWLMGPQDEEFSGGALEPPVACRPARIVSAP